MRGVAVDVVNSNASVQVSQAYAGYLRPQEILNAHVAKITATFEF